MKLHAFIYRTNKNQFNFNEIRSENKDNRIKKANNK